MKNSVLSVLGVTGAVVLSLLTSGCGGSGGAGTQSPDGSSGIQGKALITSHAGPSYVGEPAATPQPYAGTILAVEVSGGREVARTKTDVRGDFTVALDPGTYVLAPALSDTERLSSIFGQTQTVTVTANHFTAVTAAYTQSLP